MYSVTIKSMVDKFGLENLIPDIDCSEGLIFRSEVNRPALQMAGFFESFDNDRVQIMGKVEHSYLSKLDPLFREEVLRKIFSYHIPCFVICKGLQLFPEMINYSGEFGVPIFRTGETTSNFMSELNRWLINELAERITIHGVLIDIYGAGILILGESGIGKSETALELIKRGHRLIADDAVEIKKKSNSQLVGSCPELIKHFIELRGIGVIDVSQLFGISAVKESQSIDLVIKLEMWDEEKIYDRIGLTDEYYEILGNKVVCNSIPIRPGRNLALICETAAINYRQKQLGYNAAEVLAERINDRKKTVQY